MYFMENGKTGEKFYSYSLRSIIRVAYHLARCARREGNLFHIIIWNALGYRVVSVGHGSFFAPNKGVWIY